MLAPSPYNMAADGAEQHLIRTTPPLLGAVNFWELF